MKVTIEIECNGKVELMQHLSVISKQAMVELTYNEKLSIPQDKLEFSDNNCYGTHEVLIIS